MLTAIDRIASQGTTCGSRIWLRLPTWLVGLALATLAACGGGGGTGDGSAATQAPSIVTQPSDRSVVEGSAASFTVIASGSALAYQWQSSADGVSYAPVARATTATLTTAATTLAQDGRRYRVVVSNSAGSATSSAVRLTVTAVVVAPAITVQPADQNVVAPNAATFNVTATGSTLSYQWEFSSDNGASFGSVAGAADAPSLTITATTVAQSGLRYRVRVGNGAGTVVSNSALLTVQPTPAAPMFTTQPSNLAVSTGATASFVVAVSGSPAPMLQWRLNGAALATGLQASGPCAGAMLGNTTLSVLTVMATPFSCSGAVFTVVASNGVSPDATSSAATLTVFPTPVAPVVTTQPTAIVVQLPGAAVFAAAASGTPTPDVQWQISVDGGATYANIGGATSATYTTPATSIVDNGKRFRAVFTNTAGSATTAAALLTVTTPAGVSLLAGDIGGPGSLDGIRDAARHSYPYGIVARINGESFVVDEQTRTVRKIALTGAVTTLAGDPLAPAAHVDGAGSAARFVAPTNIGADGAGNLYVADTGASTIRKITPAGVVSTYAGAAFQRGAVDGPVATARFADPTGIAVDPDGTVYVGDPGAFTIRKITPAGIVSTYAGSIGTGGNLDGIGNAALFVAPSSLALDAMGNLYVADSTSSVIRKITSARVVTTLAGTANTPGSNDGLGAAALFRFPYGIAADQNGTVYVADTANATVRKITPAGVVTTFAGLPGVEGSADGSSGAARFSVPRGLSVGIGGDVFLADSSNNVVRRLNTAGSSTFTGLAARPGSADGTGAAARFARLTGIASEFSGGFVVADFDNNAVRRISAGGSVTTLAGMAGTGGSADGTGSAARFSGPRGVTLAPSGTIYVADQFNHTVRAVTATGVVTTTAGTAGVQGSADGLGTAAQFSYPAHVAADAVGNLFVADVSNHTIRKVTPAGQVTTFAGSAGLPNAVDGVGAAARFKSPAGVALDAAGNVYVADSGNHLIRKITPAGVVTTLAGSATVAGSTDGSGSTARFDTPLGVAVDSAGNVFVADTNNHAIRQVTAGGVVTTVVGRAGESGIRLGSDGRLYAPYAVAIAGTGRLAIVSGGAVLLATLP